MADTFGFALYPGTRALAYLEAFERSGAFPAEVVCLSGAPCVVAGLEDEARRYGYGTRYFPLDRDPKRWCRTRGIPLHILPRADINAPELCSHVEASPLTTWIFSGGGILREPVLSLGKRWIHVHPGRLPDFRGSTTFYYSLLAEGGLHATAFFMGSGIDDGPIVEEAAFRANVRVEADQPLFMDYILDPHIRSLVLARLLARWKTTGTLEIRRNAPIGGEPYFIMHPLLRILAIKRLNALYRAEDPARISVIGGLHEHEL